MSHLFRRIGLYLPIISVVDTFSLSGRTALGSAVQMGYTWSNMDTTVRNLDPQAYRPIRAQAVLERRDRRRVDQRGHPGISCATGGEAGRGNTAGTPAGTVSGGERRAHP